MLVCLVGRSGSGKTTISRMLTEHDDFKEIVSYTTRKARDGEVDGVDYHFLDSNKFKEMYKEDKMLRVQSIRW